MGISTSVLNTTFEDVQHAIGTPDKYYLISTASLSTKTCLIKGSIPIENEETVINSMLNTPLTYKTTIIIYGKNTTDPTVLSRYKQLVHLGFKHVYIYPGGLFEWLMLQDIYGDTVFPTTERVTDILIYKPTRLIPTHIL